MIAWDVVLDGKCIDTVFFLPECDCEYIRKSLINHDGYSPNITVRKSTKYY